MVEQLLRIAVSRWPAPLRHERAREWAAEIHHLGRWQRLRFAASLAMSPPINRAGVPMGWREMLPALGRGVQPLIVLFFCGLMCWVVAMLAIPMVSIGVTQLILGPPEPATTFNWLANGLSVAAIAVAVGVLFWIGKRVGARTRMPRPSRARLAPAFVVSAAVLVSLPQQAGATGDRTHAAQSFAVFILWAAGFTVIVAAANNARRRWLVAVMGAVVTLDLIAIVAAWPWAQEAGINLGSAPVWFPVALLDLKNSGVRFDNAGPGFIDAEMVVGNAIGPVRICLLASVFVLGYALAGRAAPARPALVSASALIQNAAVARSALRGWLLAGSGLAVWVYALTTLTAALNPQNDGGGEHHIWVHEIRQGAILVMVTGLALAIAGRGAIVFPAVLAFVALLGIDAVFDSRDAVSVQAATLAAGLGVIVLYTAWQLAQAIRTDEAAVRRTLAGFAVLGAYCTPAMVVDAILYPLANESAAYLPDGYSVGSAIVIGLLSFSAMLCAQAVRGRTHWFDSAMIAALIGSCSTLLPPLVPLILGLGTPLAALAAWYMRPPGSTTRWKRILPASLVLGTQMGGAQIITGVFLGVPLMALAGYPPPYDGLPILPGGILFGAGVAVIVSAATVSRKSAAPLMTAD
ncbi:hypothetical protein Rhe02_57390 [Rhizocola hellebori]|uniref:Uncharacterized protein n=1 Tax=Rhizocola hellebori TaxID=1392758 RepID=A0A8J3QDK4_9ACTN|nr:hypothetical protein Rhe02_57390 [Rhizocola hellebori]